MLHILPRQLRLLQFHRCDAERQFFLLLLQFLKPLFRRCSKDALLNRVEHIFNALFRLGKLTAQSGDCYIFTLLHGEQRVNDSVDLFLAQHPFHCQTNNCAFDPILLDCLFIATLFTLRIAAFIIVVHRSGVAFAAFAHHHAFTLTTEQFGSQQELAFLSFGVRRCAFVFLHALLNAIEQILRHNSGNTAGNDHILIAVLTDVFAVFKQRIEAIRVEWLTAFGCQSA